MFGAIMSEISAAPAAEQNAIGLKQARATDVAGVGPACGTVSARQRCLQSATIDASQQVALAWLPAKRPNLVPIFVTRGLDRVKENLGAAEVSLSDEDMATIEARLAGI
jgi:aryl-alcohol dehydrogenase-like predicted oxidoreductase